MNALVDITEQEMIDHIKSEIVTIWMDRLGEFRPTEEYFEMYSKKYEERDGYGALYVHVCRGFNIAPRGLVPEGTNVHNMMKKQIAKLKEELKQANDRIAELELSIDYASTQVASGTVRVTEEQMKEDIEKGRASYTGTTVKTTNAELILKKET